MTELRHEEIIDVTEYCQAERATSDGFHRASWPYVERCEGHAHSSLEKTTPWVAHARAAAVRYLPKPRVPRSARCARSPRGRARRSWWLLPRRRSGRGPFAPTRRP